MADRAASVLIKLKNKAKESGRTYQLCLQLFCQEEFFRRLEKSKYANNFVLKGGLFIYTLTEFESRATMDIDFLLQRLPNTPEQLQPIIEEIISTDTGNDFITFELQSVKPISVAKKYAGITASLVAKIKNTKTPINIDFGVGDVIIPQQEKRALPTQLAEFEKPVVNTYSLETTIAEKLDAILDLMEYSSRMKDYYDIYYLSKHFEFDDKVLAEAMKKTFANRNHTFTKKQFDRAMKFGTNPGMQKKWQAFAKKINFNDAGFEEVMRDIDAFLRTSFEFSF
ncbi:MAG: nucleotidyl transferase AbiEii/AbiGii toxin family protein [Clostridia bacterium]|nr:nucleotidyl transferase AbiEii/AbiGii toxin family protein [Clostridia bacterium]